LIAARLRDLRKLAARTCATFEGVQLRTDLSRAEVAAQMLQYLDQHIMRERD
jgi:hypothetical protein